MANSKVETELLKALKIKKRKSGEDEQDYLERVLKGIDSLDDEVWSDLSEDAQKWANDAAKKAKAKKDLPSFPVDDDDEDEDEDAADGEKDEEDPDDEGEEEEEEEKKPAKKPAKKEEKKPAKKEEKKPAKEDKKKKAKDEDEDEDGDADEAEDEDDSKSKKKAASKEKPKSEGKRSGATGVTASIKNIMLEDPQISVEDLTKKLGKAGFDTISNMTVTTVRADFRHTLKIMHAAGALSKALSSKMSDE